MPSVNVLYNLIDLIDLVVFNKYIILGREWLIDDTPVPPNKKNKPKQKLFVFVLATFHFCGGPFFLESDSPDNNNRKFSHRILVYISSHVLCSIILFQFID